MANRKPAPRAHERNSTGFGERQLTASLIDSVAGLQLAEVSGIEPIAQMIAQEIERHYRYRNEDARDQHPRIVLDILRIHRLRQQIAPTRRGLLDSQSAQRERALTEDVTRDRKRRVDCGEAKHRGNHMAEEYAAA